MTDENNEVQAEETAELAETAGVDNPEGESQQKTGPEHIPYSRFQEVWNERQEARSYAQQLQMQIMQMQQQVNALSQTQNAPRDPDVDPDVEQIVAPVLNKYVKPLVQQLNAAKAELSQVQAKAEAEAAWGYVLSHVPDMEDLKADIAKEIEGKSPVIQRKITSDPDLIIELAEKVRLKRSSGASAASSAVRNDLKSRSRSETSGTRTSPTSSNNIDWLSLSDEEFAAAEARLLRRR